MKLVKWLMPLVALLLLISCLGPSNKDTSSSGSGSEIVGNVDSSRARIAMGREAVEGADIYLLRYDHESNGFDARRTTSNDDGFFRIDSTVTENGVGLWILEAKKDSTSLAAIVDVTGDGEQIDMGSIVIKKSASLNVTINTDLGADIEYVVYLLGTRIRVDGDKDKLNFSMEGIPTGIKHRVRLKVNKPVSLPPITKEVTLPAGGSANIVFEAMN